MSKYSLPDGATLENEYAAPLHNRFEMNIAILFIDLTDAAQGNF